MRILDRYIGNSVIIATGLVVLTLLGIEMFIEFIAELPSLGVKHYDILSVFTYVGLQMPSDLYQLFPIAGFLGSLIGLGRLAATSELIVMRAAGVSISRIAFAVVKTALAMLIVVTLIGEWPAPALQYRALQFKQERMQRQINLWSDTGLWLHQGTAFVHVGAILSSTEIADVIRFDFDKKNHLLSTLSAKRAILENDQWKLQDVGITEFKGNETYAASSAEKSLGFTFQPDLLQKKMQRDTDQQTIVGLWENIQYRRQAGLLADELESAFWRRALQPLTTVVMICLGVPFIFGSLRSVSMSARVLTGIIVGFVFYILNQFLGPIALLYQWPAWIAGALPVAFFLLIYAILLSKIR